jgi:hypothetical protein
MPHPKLGGGRGGKKRSPDGDDVLRLGPGRLFRYLAADELYDGPFCVLSIVDNRTFKRLCYQVLDHDPTHDDIKAFVRRFQGPWSSAA